MPHLDTLLQKVIKVCILNLGGMLLGVEII